MNLYVHFRDQCICIYTKNTVKMSLPLFSMEVDNYSLYIILFFRLFLKETLLIETSFSLMVAKETAWSTTLDPTERVLEFYHEIHQQTVCFIEVTTFSAAFVDCLFLFTNKGFCKKHVKKGEIKIVFVLK